ncbi:MAG: phosphoesterase PA-phosphatase, partial [Chloroflexi bacterium]|nr:phosphoesterase PA-phosphatase [Chloroflexota bacterium]
SVFFDSSVLSLFIFPAIGWQADGWRGVGWSLIALLILSGLPLIYILLGLRRGWVSDLELSHREERPRFILVSISSDILALAILYFGGAPRLVWILALTYACLGLTMFTISNFWKISLHMVGVSGFSTMLVYIFGFGAWWTFLSLPLVAWARLYRKKHTPAQLLAGALGGSLITAAVFTLIA